MTVVLPAKKRLSEGPWVICLFMMVLAAVLAPNLRAQAEDNYPARKEHALGLYRQNKFVDALPLLEKLHAEKPDDIVVLECLSMATMEHSATLTDETERKKERARARGLADEAKAAGDNSNLLKVLLDVPPDGGELSFSSNADVEAAMREGEAAFAKGEFDAAIAAYDRALALDPKQYNAALFIGDVYFKKGEHDQAGQGFLRAIGIDPNRETAYRYWGDSLSTQNRASEAREQFISAVVAEPYERKSWVGLSQWAEHQKMSIRNPVIHPPGKIEDKGVNEKGQSQTNITLDPSMLNPNAKKDGTSCWFMYTLARATWHGERFQKEFPAEKQYRHSLPEEVDGFQLVIGQVKEGLKKKEIKKLDPALATLVKLSDSGLLEPYILLAVADSGIAKDYPSYRDAHREKIRQYISEWMLQPAAQR